MEEKRLIVKPFNLIYIIQICIYGALGFFIGFISKKSDYSNMRDILFWISIAQIIIFIFYRYIIKFDKEYINILYREEGKINYYAELPFNPCNIIMILAPIAIYTNNSWLLSFVFYFSLIIPTIGTLMPCKGFEKYSILKPRIIFFYNTHYMLLVCAILMVVGKVYVPEYIDILKALFIFFISSLLVYAVNKILRKTNKLKTANYYFMIDSSGYGIFKFLNKLIPYEYFYVLPLEIIFGAFFLLVTFIIKLF